MTHHIGEAGVVFKLFCGNRINVAVSAPIPQQHLALGQ
jgi:hypothetical protein